MTSPSESLAALHHRAAAFSIDLLAPWFVGVFASIPATVIALGLYTEDEAHLVAPVVVAVGYAVTTLAQWAALGVSGQTLGKWALGIRVVGPDGARAGFLRVVVVRTLLFGVLRTCCGILGYVDFLAAWSSSRRCLHDLVAGTQVIDLTGGSALELESETP